LRALECSRQVRDAECREHRAQRAGRKYLASCEEFAAGRYQEAEDGVLSLFLIAETAELSQATGHTVLDLRSESQERRAGEERRRAPRLPLPAGVAGTTATGHLVELLNTSPGGLLLRSIHPVRAGERHLLRVPDNEAGCVTLEVSVVHAENVAESWGQYFFAGVALAN
jgi:hypothetical protein